VRLRFSPSLREALADIVGRVHSARATGPDEQSAPAPIPDELPDPELQAAWAEGLREREEYDTRALLDLMMNPQFGLADLAVTPATAEALARASAHARLYLRETLLRDLNSTQVDGDLDIFHLSPIEQQGYACFRLLAYFETDLILQLDSGAAKS
jgi:hypothetical protein